MEGPVAVVGGGTMGSGIAQCLAAAGCGVILVEANKDLAEKALSNINANLDRRVSTGELAAAEKEAALSRLKTAGALAEAAPAAIAIEAVPEDLEFKRQVFAALDAVLSRGAIIASNTSLISIAALAAATRRPDRVIGMHFMYPVPAMKLVELVRAPSTSAETYATIRALALKLGKTPVTSKDSPGFISNRVLMPMINEAAYALMEGVATKEDIDTVMKLGMNHPLGPLALADMIGIDVCLASMKVLQEGFKDAKYAPCPLLRRLVEQGSLGRKSGKGFYDYA
jgi:3-hydroxybutyryl-CoA dehydrogenase